MDLVLGVGVLAQPTFLSRGLIAFFLFASFGTLWSGMALPLAGEPWRLSEAQIGLFAIAGLADARGCMVFYSLGSALGATATTALFDAAGRPGPTTLGATLALCALATWALTDRTTNLVATGHPSPRWRCGGRG